jgi:hypothetical protein
MGLVGSLRVVLEGASPPRTGANEDPSPPFQNRGLKPLLLLDWMQRCRRWKTRGDVDPQLHFATHRFALRSYCFRHSGRKRL